MSSKENTDLQPTDNNSHLPTLADLHTDEKLDPLPDVPTPRPTVQPSYSRYQRNLRRKQWKNCYARCVECPLSDGRNPFPNPEWPSCNKDSEYHEHRTIHSECAERTMGEYIYGPIACAAPSGQEDFGYCPH